MQVKATAMGSTGWQARYLARHRLPDSYLVYARKWFAPLAGWLVEHQKGANRPILVALNGSQGSGKSTVCDYLRETLEHDHGLKAIALSIDDFYLTLDRRRELAATVHPLLATRGVPGTHDMTLLRHTLDGLLAPDAGGPVEIPRFDKARDDRLPREAWDSVNDGVDVVLLEGWCVGVRPQQEGELAVPVNALERQEDPQGRWRALVNDTITREFMPLYARVDQWVMLCAPSFDCVYQWRLEQERKLADLQASPGDNRIMDEGQLARFIQFYERLTRHCLNDLPPRVHHLYRLDTRRQVVEQAHRGKPLQ